MNDNTIHISLDDDDKQYHGGAGGSSPLGRTKNTFKNNTLQVVFLFL